MPNIGRKFAPQEALQQDALQQCNVLAGRRMFIDRSKAQRSEP